MKLERFLAARVCLGNLLLGLFALAILVTGIINAASSWAIETDDDDALPAVTIIDSNTLQADGQLSRKTQKPLLILFAMEDCAYCEFVEEEHLKPMLRNQDYLDKVIIRRVMTDDFDDVIDFDGTKISSLDFSARYGAYVTPTVVFLNHKGMELSQRLLGVRNTEFYGGELDDGLEISLRKLRQQLATAQIESKSR